MESPVFLSLGEVLEIHRDQIARFGGDQGLRDLGMLQSALAMPAASFGGKYAHASLYEMAAAYLFHIVQNHPFVDGNKRVAAVAAIIFLELNDLELDAAEDKLADIVISAAQGHVDKSELAEFFRSHTH